MATEPSECVKELPLAKIRRTVLEQLGWQLADVQLLPNGLEIRLRRADASGMDHYASASISLWDIYGAGSEETALQVVREAVKEAVR